MKVGNINNGFAMQSFGGGKKIKAKQIKKAKTNINILPRITNQTTAVSQKALQTQISPNTVSKQFKKHQQLLKHRKNLIQNKQQNIQQPPEISFEYINYNNQYIINSPRNELERTLDESESILKEKEKIQNQILQNREKHIKKHIHNFNFTQQCNKIKNDAISYLTNFQEILKNRNEPELKAIKKQVNEVLKAQKTLYSQIIVPHNLLYIKIAKNREQNIDYELSPESLNDNLQLLDMEKNAAKQINMIEKKNENINLRKKLNDMKSCFNDNIIENVEKAFSNLNQIDKYQNIALKKDIMYHEQNTNLISQAVMLQNEQFWPESNLTFMQNSWQDENIMFQTFLSEIDTNINLNTNENHFPAYSFSDVNLDLDIDELQLHLPEDNQ